MQTPRVQTDRATLRNMGSRLWILILNHCLLSLISVIIATYKNNNHHILDHQQMWFKNYLKGLLIFPPKKCFKKVFLFQPRLAFAELSLDFISELSYNVSVPIFSVTTNTLDSFPKHQHNNNVSLSGSPSPLPGTGTYITPPADFPPGFISVGVM